MTKSEIAGNFFKQGANCAQAVAAAFAPEVSMSEVELFKLASGFGGGFGRRREVCGAVSGMVLIANMLYGNDDITDKSAKDDHYARIRKLLKEFETQNSSLICRELLGLDKNGETTHVSEPRSKEYYQTRPCVELVASAAEILEKAITAS
ncbi:MAG: C_GCAxxG_C_C family protein [Lentisphaerae bacterium]|nr:C_GCAxxG_C_C family protein [Lentisphaerota bacterium]